VTVDESWAHYFQPETKTASKEWRHPKPPKHKKFRAKPSSGKVMPTLLWESKGPILEHYMSKGKLITNSLYCDLLVNHLKPAIRSKHHGLPICGVLPLHDNAQPHTAHATVAKINELLLSISLIHRTHQTLCLQTFKWQCKNGCADYQNFLRGIQALVQHWNKCIEHNGDYAEKLIKL
jgi:hypothetical protein